MCSTGTIQQVLPTMISANATLQPKPDSQDILTAVTKSCVKLCVFWRHGRMPVAYSLALCVPECGMCNSYSNSASCFISESSTSHNPANTLPNQRPEVACWNLGTQARVKWRRYMDSRSWDVTLETAYEPVFPTARVLPVRPPSPQPARPWDGRAHTRAKLDSRTQARRSWAWQAACSG